MVATGAEKVVVAEKTANATIIAAKINAKSTYARAGASVLSTGLATLAAYMYFKPVEDESKKLKDELKQVKDECKELSISIVEQKHNSDRLETILKKAKDILTDDQTSDMKQYEKDALDVYLKKLAMMQKKYDINSVSNTSRRI